MASSDLNRAWWDERAALHADTPMYRPWIAALREGRSALRPIEVSLAGEVRGRRLLHVQCHIGHDTLSWALLGAEVTGVDLSPVALAQAEALAAELGLPARWVQADATDLPRDLVGFDVVVSTYGVVGWLPALDGWAAGIARALAPEGRFVLVDGHPAAYALHNGAERPEELVPAYPYGRGAHLVEERSGTYADPDAVTVANRTEAWCWGLGDVVGALTRAGLVIDHLGEHHECVWQMYPCCVRRDEAWVLPEPFTDRVPLMFSLRARRA